MVDKQLPRLTEARATLVTICVGVNDLLCGREMRKFAEDYETLVARLKQPDRLIVIANLPDVAYAPAMKGRADESLRLRLEQFNKAIEDIAGRHAVPLVDLYKLSGEMTRSRPEFFPWMGCTLSSSYTRLSRKFDDADTDPYYPRAPASPPRAKPIKSKAAFKRTVLRA